MARTPVTLRALVFWLFYAALTVAGAYLMYTQSAFWTGSMTLSELLKMWHVYNYYYMPFVVLSLALYAVVSQRDRLFAGASAVLGGLFCVMVWFIMLLVKNGVLT
jgi:hypothetical protein